MTIEVFDTDTETTTNFAAHTLIEIPTGSAGIHSAVVDLSNMGASDQIRFSWHSNLFGAGWFPAWTSDLITSPGSVPVGLTAPPIPLTESIPLRLVYQQSAGSAFSFDWATYRSPTPPTVVTNASNATVGAGSPIVMHTVDAASGGGVYSAIVRLSLTTGDEATVTWQPSDTGAAFPAITETFVGGVSAQARLIPPAVAVADLELVIEQTLGSAFNFSYVIYKVDG